MEQIHRKTGTKYDHWYFINENSPATEHVETGTGDPSFESDHVPRNLVDQLNGLDRFLDNFFATPPSLERLQQYLEKVSEAQSLVTYLQNKTFKRWNAVDTDVDRINATPAAARTPGDARRIPALTVELGEHQTFAGWLESMDLRVKEYALTPTEYRLANIFLEIGKKMGNHNELASVNQFREFVLDYINTEAEDVTKGDVSYGHLYVQDHNSNHMGILDLFTVLEQQEHHLRPELTRYLQAYFESVFAYGNWRMGSRKQRNLVYKNYTDNKKLQEALESASNFDKDDNILEIYKGGHTFKDKFETPSAERTRAAVTAYEGLYFINLINDKLEKDSPDLLARAQAIPRIVRDARSYYSPAVLTDAQLVFYFAAEELRIQQGLEYLTHDEAAFLLKNVTPMMPIERTTQSDLMKGRTAIKLFCSAGPVREDRFKTPEELMYSSLISERLTIEMNGTAPIFKYDGAVVSHGSHPRVIPPYDLHDVLSRMLKYGERVEGGAYDLAWATHQMAQADATGAFGFAKKEVWYSHMLIYSQRYKDSDYATVDLEMAKVINRLQLTFPSQMRVNIGEREISPGVRVPKRNQESLIHLMADPTVDFMEPAIQKLYTDYVTQEEIKRAADNLKRANDMFDVMEKGIFGYIGVNFDELRTYVSDSKAGGQLNIEKTAEGFRTVYKIIKYFVEMFVMNESVEKLFHKQELIDEYKDELVHGSEASANRLLIEDLFLDIVEKSLVDYFEDLAKSQVSGADLLGDDTIRTKLQELKRLLVEPGIVRTGGRVVRGEEKARPLIYSEDPDDQNFKELSKGTIAQRFINAAAIGRRIATGNYQVMPSKKVKPYDRYVQKLS